MATRPETGTTEPTEFPLPVEVKNLPEPLSKPLTLRQRRADERRRDELLRLNGSAARLTEHERTRAHAIVRSTEYQVELDRLIALRPLKFKERHVTKLELERIVKATARNLSDALADQGELVAAGAVLAEHDPKSKKQWHIAADLIAIARPDDDHCACPPEEKFTKKVRWVPGRQAYVEFLACQCGHTNATEQLPDDVAALRRAPTAFNEQRVPDEHLLVHAKRVK